MNRTVVGTLIGGLLLGSGAYTLWERQPNRGAVAAAAEIAPVPRLEFRDLFEPGPVLKPTAKAAMLNGTRVRMVGFMARMELPPTGGFYLAPRPVRCDEAGGGTADLPPDSVFVISKSAGSGTVPFIEGALDVTGVFELGNHADKSGRTSAFRIALDGPDGPASSGLARADSN